MELDFEIMKTIDIELDIGNTITTDVVFKKTTEFNKDIKGQVTRKREEIFSPKLYDCFGVIMTKDEFNAYIDMLYEEINLEWEVLEDLFGYSYTPEESEAS
jgi:hypothetical protein